MNTFLKKVAILLMMFLSIMNDVSSSFIPRTPKRKGRIIKKTNSNQSDFGGGSMEPIIFVGLVFVLLIFSALSTIAIYLNFHIYFLEFNFYKKNYEFLQFLTFVFIFVFIFIYFWMQ